MQYDVPGARHAKPETVPALSVEGTIQHPGGDEKLEYSMMLSIRNERGEEIARQMVGVGALSPAERRTFTVAVSVSKHAKLEPTKTR